MFHGWKANRGLKLSPNSRTPVNNHLYIYGLWQIGPSVKNVASFLFRYPSPGSFASNGCRVATSSWHCFPPTPTYTLLFPIFMMYLIQSTLFFLLRSLLIIFFFFSWTQWRVLSMRIGRGKDCRCIVFWFFALASVLNALLCLILLVCTFFLPLSRWGPVLSCFVARKLFFCSFCSLDQAICMTQST
jgi:hypothetical protein